MMNNKTFGFTSVIVTALCLGTFYLFFVWTAALSQNADFRQRCFDQKKVPYQNPYTVGAGKVECR